MAGLVGCCLAAPLVAHDILAASHFLSLEENLGLVWSRLQADCNLPWALPGPPLAGVRVWEGRASD